MLTLSTENEANRLMHVKCGKTPSLSHGRMQESRQFSTENSKMVVLRPTRPGRSSVEGNAGWLGESGKCCVSRHSPAYFSCPSNALPHLWLSSRWPVLNCRPGSVVETRRVRPLSGQCKRTT